MVGLVELVCEFRELTSMLLQDPSLALVPNSSHGASKVSIQSTASSLGLHDAMRYGTRSLAADVAPKHPLEARLEGVSSTRGAACAFRAR